MEPLSRKVFSRISILSASIALANNQGASDAESVILSLGLLPSRRSIAPAKIGCYAPRLSTDRGTATLNVKRTCAWKKAWSRLRRVHLCAQHSRVYSIPTRQDCLGLCTTSNALSDEWSAKQVRVANYPPCAPGISPPPLSTHAKLDASWSSEGR